MSAPGADVAAGPARYTALSHAAVSRRGGRSRNEDALRCFETGSGVHGWALADGLGGHVDGDIAANLAVDQVHAAFLDAEATMRADIVDADAFLMTAIHSAFEAANSAVVMQGSGRDDPRHMGATLVVAAVLGERVAWAHVGDSRVYRFTAGEFRSVSRDHSTVALAAAPARDERHDESRNRLLAVIGGADDVRPDFADTPTALAAEDVLLLCSDGWWSLVLETEMEIDLAASRTPEDWLQRMEDRLLERAQGEFDNYSAIAVWGSAWTATARI